jgi:hypothetical protein
MSLQLMSFLALGALAAGCGSRDAAWDTPVASSIDVGQLRNAAVLVDSGLNRGLVVKATADQTIVTTAVPLGKRIALTATAPDRSRVFVLSQGEEVRLRPNDEGPALTVIDQGHPDTPTRYPLSDPLTSLAIDPTGQWAIVYAGNGASSSFLTNPNELLLVDLTHGPSATNPTAVTLPSKEGGAPNRLTFSPEMDFPSGKRRLLIVETDRDLLLVDIDNLDSGNITLPLSDPHTDPRPLSPASIAVDPGDSQAMRDPAIAIRSTSDDNVLVYKLKPSPLTPGHNDFIPVPNFAPAGGIPSDIAFVRTKQGVRLAVVVPSPSPRGLLVNIDDNETLSATFAQPYQRLSLVTDLVSDASPDGDQVLLWAGGGASSVALWDLGAVPSAAQADIDTVKSIETLNLSGSVVSVMDVQQKDFQSLKVLQTSGQFLYVLDLKQHQASPLAASSTVALRLGLQGDRAWAFQPAAPDLARVGLSNAHVQSVVIDRAVDDVLEIDRSDVPQSQAQALLALHGVAPSGTNAPNRFAGDVGLTIFDAQAPEASTSRRYSSLMLERLAP